MCAITSWILIWVLCPPSLKSPLNFWKAPSSQKPPQIQIFSKSPLNSYFCIFSGKYTVSSRFVTPLNAYGAYGLCNSPYTVSSWFEMPPQLLKCPLNQMPPQVLILLIFCAHSVIQDRDPPSNPDSYCNPPSNLNLTGISQKIRQKSQNIGYFACFTLYPCL